MAKAPKAPEIYRTRLFLVTPKDYALAAFLPKLEAVLAAGDIATLLILPPKEGGYQEAAEAIIPLAQRHDIAALLYNDSRLMGRTGADGLLLDGPLEDIVETVRSHAGKNIMGVGNIKARHEAMIVGEGPVDFLFFGRLGGDNAANIFPKTFKLAEWWCSLMEIPGVVMGGNTIESASDAAVAGIDFVVLCDAIWHSEDPASAVRSVNRLLDQRFEERRAAQDG
ncbi:MAG: thiamine phosphate synthase [Rhizobiales bacterium]|nr:thiamine phosphate synthase [Hyphomicrobiales bacterium]